MGKPTGGENWGLGLLFVFFPDEPIVARTQIFSSSSFRRPSSSSNPILSKAQFTISICFVLVCLTFLLFTLSTFEPSAGKPQIGPSSSRRLMSEKSEPRPRSNSNSKSNPSSSFWVRSRLKGRSDSGSDSALQGMGTLFRRGTRAMADLVVGHLVENVTDGELRLFLRLLHRSGLTARSDLVLVFDSPETARRFEPVIGEENDSFLRLVDRYRKIDSGAKPGPPAGFNVTRFAGSGKPEKEPVWGKKKKNSGNWTDESGRLSYGSVVGFDAAELDPESSLSGFLNPVPMGLRRWACYPMLLGRVRRNFKHTMLVDVKNLLILGDPLGRVRNRSPESVLLTRASSGGSTRPVDPLDRVRNRSPESTRPVDPAIVIGGSRGVRRLAGAMPTEIARAAMQKRGGQESPVTESGVLSQLAGNEVVVKGKGIDLMTSAEPIPDPSSIGSGFDSGRPIIYRGNSNGNNNLGEVRKVIMKQICSLEVESTVYSDC